MVKITQFYFKILFFLASILRPTLRDLTTISAAGSDRQIFFIKVHKLNHYHYTKCYKLHKLRCHSLQIYDSNSKKFNIALSIFTVVIRSYTVLYIKYLNNNDILLKLVLCKLTCTVLTVVLYNGKCQLYPEWLRS